MARSWEGEELCLAFPILFTVSIIEERFLVRMPERRTPYCVLGLLAKNQNPGLGLGCLGSSGAGEPNTSLWALLESHRELHDSSPHLTLRQSPLQEKRQRVRLCSMERRGKQTEPCCGLSLPVIGGPPGPQGWVMLPLAKKSCTSKPWVGTPSFLFEKKKKKKEEEKEERRRERKGRKERRKEGEKNRPRDIPRFVSSRLWVCIG